MQDPAASPPEAPAQPGPDSGESGRHLSDADAVRLGTEMERLRALEARMHRLIKELEENLRGPVTTMRLEIYLLESGKAGPLDEDGRRAVGRIRAAVDRAVAATERILALAGDPRTVKEPEPVDLGRLESEVVHTFADRALKDGVRLHEAPAVVPVVVRVPPEALRQALAVLLEHALTATPAGSHVLVSCHTEGGQGVLEVQDGGPGLTREELSSLDDPDSWAAIGGGSWAVPLVRAAILAESFSGRLSLESDGPGLGLCRVLHLPLEPVAAAGP